MIEVADKSKCCGCAACAGVCPQKCVKMEEDGEGFFYPRTDKERCTDCGLCVSVCPVINSVPEREHRQTGYVVQNKNLTVLKESTSGGFFTAAAKYVLRRGGVVYGAALDNEMLPHHICVDNESGLSVFRNSKYVQSYISPEIYMEIKSFLNKEKIVLFSGTPCQIEGLRYFLKTNYDNLITIDVVCRAVPSRMIFSKYLDYQKNKFNSEIISVRFRDKYFGYDYSTMNIAVKNKNINYHRGIESDRWLRAFFSNICDRPSCHSCVFKKRYRLSDFTMWDCLNVGNYSKKLDNNNGATRILTQSAKAENIFNEISEELNYVSVPLEDILKESVEMTESVPPHSKRQDFFRDASVLDSGVLFDKYFPETLRIKAERSIRLLCCKIGIYSIMKKIYKKYFMKNKK